MSLIQLFFTFLYIGTFTIGGGLVAITLMQEQIVNKGLLTLDQFFNMVAISESTPGPIGINMATYIGCELYGPIGGIITTIGTVIPSLVVILLIAKFFGRIQEKKLVQNAFTGLRPAVTGMIAVAAWNIISITLIDLSAFSFSDFSLSFLQPVSIIFFAICLCILIKTKLHPVITILLGAAFGILFL